MEGRRASCGSGSLPCHAKMNVSRASTNLRHCAAGSIRSAPPWSVYREQHSLHRGFRALPSTHTAVASSAPSKTVFLGRIAAAEMPMPFRIGEILNYRVEWAIFPNAAALQIIVVERRNLLGWQTWHFRASAHSQVPARTLFEVDDQFDSYPDASHAREPSIRNVSERNGLNTKHEVLHLVAAPANLFVATSRR